MRIHLLSLLTITVLLGCGPPKRTEPPPPNRWADERLWPVLEAQEHRDTEALCALLHDTAATVRSAAALAFASVQDTMSAACLLDALFDPVVDVRVNAVFALGFIANDSTVERMAARSDQERDSTVHRAYLSAMFLNLQRRGKMKELAPAIHYLERNSGQERLRAADAIRRYSPALLLKDSALVLRAIAAEKDPDAKALLIRALTQIPGPERQRLLLEAGNRDQPLPLRISAITALGFKPDGHARDSLLAWVNDPIPAVRTAAIDALNLGGVFSSGKAYWSVVDQAHWLDDLTECRLHGLVGQNTVVKQKAILALRIDTALSPYAEAERIKALSMVDPEYGDDVLEAILYSDKHPAIRQAAFGVLADRVQWAMTIPRAISYDMQIEQAAPFWQRVFGSGDAGLICAAAEKLAGGRSRELKVLFPPKVEQRALDSLHPLRDLEAVQLLNELARTREDSLPAPHHAPPFNHAIDPIKLRALKQGQRYRIVTNKGEIVISTDVDECP
ncbi:MAG: HEAT repeat domain-containing protein, partial [Flavobacteriales bacterium]|nr:HEAT repeat domain-containing protein [Flavobacteriales bacterium]